MVHILWKKQTLFIISATFRKTLTIIKFKKLNFLVALRHLENCCNIFLLGIPNLEIESLHF